MDDHIFVDYDSRKTHSSFKREIWNIAREKKYKHLKKEGEKTDDFEKRIGVMLLDKNQQKIFFEYFRYSLDQKTARENQQK